MLFYRHNSDLVNSTVTIFTLGCLLITLQSSRQHLKSQPPISTQLMFAYMTWQCNGKARVHTLRFLEQCGSTRDLGSTPSQGPNEGYLILRRLNLTSTMCHFSSHVPISHGSVVENTREQCIIMSRRHTRVRFPSRDITSCNNAVFGGNPCLRKQVRISGASYP